MSTLADLAAAVPAAIVTVAGWTVDRRVKEAETLADTIACGADILTAAHAVAIGYQAGLLPGGDGR